MLTELFAVTSGLDAESVTAAVPPSCRRPSGPAPPIAVEGDAAVVEVSGLRPRVGARHLLPSLSLLSAEDYSFRFELSARIDRHWSPWIGAAPIGPASFPPIIDRAEGIASEVDLFRAETAVDEVRLRVRIVPAAVASSPWLLTLSACDLSPVSVERPLPAAAAALAVPSRSQMEEAASLRDRLCSPTSLAMVLEYWKSAAEVGTIASELFHPALDLYGVWPSAIRAAARRGIAGYLLRFPDWQSAAWMIDRGMPVIASVRYEDGELTGAAIPRTSGHLLVLTGHAGDHVLVNDPAAPTRSEVARRYRLDQLRRAWLDRAGVGYVFFKP